MSAPGRTVIILDPILEICFLMLSFEPSPMASIAITEATPIMIPSIVKKVLILLSTMAFQAILNKFRILMLVFFFWHGCKSFGCRLNILVKAVFYYMAIF